MVLHVSHVSKAYPGLPVLHDVSFNVNEGEILCLLGPSGAGKTTLLHIIAGLETADSGTVSFAGQDLSGVPVHRRNFGLMFQDYALFPHKDVFANIAFGLRMQGYRMSDVARRVQEVLALVKLEGYERRRVLDLSGGEQQRVALARSLAPRPRLLMLDEPLGSLDRALREQLMNEVRAILKQVGLTALYVTHDQQEAFAVADCIMIMSAAPGEGGHIEQAGTPQEVYRQPANPFVAQFLGFRNLFKGKVLAADRGQEGYTVETSLGPLRAQQAAAPFAPGDAVTVLVRPEAAQLRPPGVTGANVVHGQLQARSFRGAFYLVQTVHPGDIELTSEVSASEAEMPEPGESLALWLEPGAVILLPEHAGW
jgi:ABC-type Fe3+/spermidine/putrescine transport system ATPase subunit